MKFLFMIIMLGSCANVAQIDRGILSSKIMQPNFNAKPKAFLNEARAFREAAAGGTGNAVGGGL